MNKKFDLWQKFTHFYNRSFQTFVLKQRIFMSLYKNNINYFFIRKEDVTSKQKKQPSQVNSDYEEEGIYIHIINSIYNLDKNC